MAVYSAGISAMLWKNDAFEGYCEKYFRRLWIYGGRTVGIVDERSEIAACFQGVPQNDVGIRSDVLDGCPKAEGMMMLIRSMSPRVVAADEIGEKEIWRPFSMRQAAGAA